MNEVLVSLKSITNDGGSVLLLPPSIPGKYPLLFDITDDLSYKSHKNHTLNHGIERYKIYSQEQFKIKMIKVKLE